MPKKIVKNLTVTKVSYSLVVVEENVPKFVPQEEAIFNGILSSEKIQKLLKEKHGKDTIIVVTKKDSGRHRFVMDWCDFVRYSTVADSLSDDGNTDEVEENDDSAVDETEELERSTEELDDELDFGPDETEPKPVMRNKPSVIMSVDALPDELVADDGFGCLGDELTDVVPFK